MALPASGPLTLANIQTEFGGTNPIGMNEYYAGGGLVPAGTSGTYGAVPSSGALSVQNFYGTSAVIPAYIEEVFSTFLYTGTGSAQTITNGVNLSANGGMVWLKARNVARNHSIIDSARGITKVIYPEYDFAQDTATQLVTAFNTTGFSLGTDVSANASGDSLVSWTFQKKPKFFDVVTYTGAGTANPSNISHNLGSTPGFIMVKQYSASGNNWICYHTSLGNTQGIILNSTGTPITSSGLWNNTSPTSTQFTVGTSAAVNGSGSYVAYLFAHNAGGFGVTGTDNVVSCGSFTTDGSGVANVNLGYEPQWVLYKRSDSSAGGGWGIVDSMRGFTANSNSNDNLLFANLSDVETQSTFIQPNSTGFSISNSGFASRTYIYIAIRRGPMKVPTLGTTVFSPVAQAGNGSTQNITTGFTTDLVLGGSRTANPIQGFVDRLRGLFALLPNNTSAEDPCPSGRDLTSFASNTGFTLGYPPFATSYNFNGNNIYWNFRRAPSFFDIVCYSGTGTSNSSVNHNLGVVPELFIVKRRNTGGSGDVNWGVYSKDRPSISQNLILNSTTGWYNAGTNGWFGTGTLSSTLFPSGNASANFGNLSGGLYVAYLFATCAGVSKVGSYTGTGATQTINCGFAAGSRFVLIKATSTTGDWLVWDSARGIIPSNDPYLALNTTNAEVTGTDWVDTTAVGFELSNAGGNLANSNGVTYIFLAIA